MLHIKFIYWLLHKSICCYTEGGETSDLEKNVSVLDYKFKN